MRNCFVAALLTLAACTCESDEDPPAPVDAGDVDALGVPPGDAGADAGGGGGGDAGPVIECNPSERDSIVLNCDHWAFTCNGDFMPGDFRSFATCISLGPPGNLGVCGDDPMGDCETNCSLIGGVAECRPCVAENGPLVPEAMRLPGGAACTTNNECALECCLEGSCI